MQPSANGTFNLSAVEINLTRSGASDFPESLATWNLIQNIAFFTSFVIHGCSILLNSSTLLILAGLRHHLSPSLYLIVHLSISDLVTSVTGLLYVVLSFLVQMKTELSDQLRVRQSMMQFQCGLYYVGHVWDAATYANLFTLILLAVDHWVAIHKPLRYQTIVTKRRLYVSTIIMWCTAGLMGFMSEFFIVSSDMESKGYFYSKTSPLTYECFRLLSYMYYTYYSERNGTPDKVVLFASSCSVIGIALILIVYVYVSIYIVVRNLMPVHAHGSNWKTEGAKRPSNRKAIVTTLALQVAFLLGYAPYFVYQIIETFLDVPTLFPNDVARAVFGIFTITMVSVCSLLDPIIYASRMSDVRRVISRVANRIKCCKIKRRSDSSYDVSSDSVSSKTHKSTFVAKL